MLAFVVMNQSIERPVVMRLLSVTVLLYVTREHAHDDGANRDRREVVRSVSRILVGRGELLLEDSWRKEGEEKEGR